MKSSKGIFYLKYGQGCQSIVLLPGWGQTTAMWADLLQYIAKEFTVYSLDLPGFGRSQTPAIDYTIDKLINDIAELLIELKIKKPILIGHSFGGVVALELSKQISILKTILIGSNPLIGNDPIINIFRIFHAFPKLFYLISCQTLHPLSYRNYTTYELARSKVMLKIFLELHKKQVTFDKNVPISIIHGVNDRIASRKNSQKSLKLYDNITMVDIPNAGHFPHIQNPNKFYEILAKIL